MGESNVKSRDFVIEGPIIHLEIKDIYNKYKQFVCVHTNTYHIKISF